MVATGPGGSQAQMQQWNEDCKAVEDTCKATTFASGSLTTSCCETKATCAAFSAKAATTSSTASSETSSGTYQLRPLLSAAVVVVASLFMGQK